MRILLLIHYWAPEVGAPQRRWHQLAESLISRGHELAVLTPSPHYPTGRLLTDDRKCLPGAASRDVTGAMVHRTIFRQYGSGLAGRGTDQVVAAADTVRLGMRRFRGRHCPDVILGSVPGLPTLPAALTLGRMLRRPVVAELRDAWPDLLASADRWTASSGPHTPPEPAGLRPRVSDAIDHGKRSILPRLITRLEQEAAAVVTTTDSFTRTLRLRGVRRVVTVRNTYDATLTATGVNSPPRSDEALHVLYLGTVGRAQGLHCAVRAARIAQQRGTRVVLRIVGDGAQVKDVSALARRIGAPVQMHPAVPFNEVSEHYAWADTVLVSLQDWPAMSLTVPSKLYEALALGLHVSAAVSGEARRIVEDSGGGDTTTPQDPEALAALWAALARDRSRLRVVGGNRWLARHADGSEMTDRYEALLREVTGD